MRGVQRADGSFFSDTYTEVELVRCALWCLQKFSGTQHVYIGLRDAAMLLFSTTTAVHGGSSRILRWSDLFMSEIPMDDVRLGKKVLVSCGTDGCDNLNLSRLCSQVLAALADNAKHNQQGRVDEHGTLRHRIVELCSVGALARLFFAYFHIMKKPTPNFIPDFTKSGYGEYVHRDWYDYHVFAGKEDVKSKMSYDSKFQAEIVCASHGTYSCPSDHHKRITIMHKENNVEITKATHAGRCYGAKNSRAHGATVGGTKALGGWNENGSFRNCYDRAFPVDALLGAASFNARKPEEYFLARDELRECLMIQPFNITLLTILPWAGPPADVLAYLFPWVEAELAALEVRMSQSRLNRDIALKQFLRLLQWLRIVLVQDCALLYARYPACPMFRFAPFTYPGFTTFSANAAALVIAAEEDARLAFHNLPDHMARSIRGYATDLQMKQEQNHSRVCEQLLELQQQTARLELLLGNSKGSKRKTNGMFFLIKPS